MNPKAQIAILIIDKIEFKANVDFKTRWKWRKKAHFVYEYIFTVKNTSYKIQWCILKYVTK